MRVLDYKREKCKYDFIVVSDNEELLKIYERMYSCDSFLLTAEKPDLHKIRKKFTALYAKDICCIYCPQNTSTAFPCSHGRPNYKKSNFGTQTHCK